MQKFKSFILLVLTILAGSCSVSKKTGQNPAQSVIYKPSVNIVRPEYKVFHISDTISRIYINFNYSDLVFNKANPDNILMAKIRIKCYLFKNTDSTLRIVDSALLFRDVYWNSTRQTVNAFIDIHAVADNNYLSKIEVYDLLREIGTQTFIQINKQKDNNSQFFRITSATTNEPVLKSYLGTSDSFYINTSLPTSNMFIKYASKETDIPSFPDSEHESKSFRFNSDTIWQTSINLKKRFCLKQKGLYFFQSDTLTGNGICLSNFGIHYPLIETLEDMTYPLVYITTPEELKTICENENQKVAMDNFWLRFSRNTEICREQIRIYYNRVKYANIYFTSYKEGWKTDRGMIYVIFGPPAGVKKTPYYETWTYRPSQGKGPLSVMFIRNKNTYSDNSFILKHSDSLTYYWNIAVNAWRKGEAFCLE